MRILALPLTLAVLTPVVFAQAPAAPAKAAAPAADWRSAPAADWQTIFNGKNLDGWVGYEVPMVAGAGSRSWRPSASSPPWRSPRRPSASGGP